MKDNRSVSLRERKAEKSDYEKRPEKWIPEMATIRVYETVAVMYSKTKIN